MIDFRMKRIPIELRSASCELRARQSSQGLPAARSSRLAAGLLALFIFCGSTLLAQDPDATVKVDVKLVNVFVTVTDARGAPVANLQKENFLLPVVYSQSNLP